MIQRTWSQISEEEVNQFEAADFKGWESLEKEFKAVKVWKGEEAARLRSMYPDWIGSKAKANSWTLSVQCKIQVLRAWSQGSGQRDLQDICTDLSRRLSTWCVKWLPMRTCCRPSVTSKAAFAQSNRLTRPQGRLLVDAPIRWFEAASVRAKRIEDEEISLGPASLRDIRSRTH